MLKFTIEQIAICPKDAARAEALLRDMGAVDWVHDHVSADGAVFGKKCANEADLHFNYQMFSGKEFEILDYTQGENWMDNIYRGRNAVSHLGMHCSAEELDKWREFFAARGIGVAQEVFTTNHTNEAIAGKRWYNYVIFDTKDILGVDLKFIVRKAEPPTKSR